MTPAPGCSARVNPYDRLRLDMGTRLALAAACAATTGVSRRMVACQQSRGSYQRLGELDLPPDTWNALRVSQDEG